MIYISDSNNVVINIHTNMKVNSYLMVPKIIHKLKKEKDVEKKNIRRSMANRAPINYKYNPALELNTTFN